DLRNLMKNTALGIHIGCIGGTWQALVFHLLGFRYNEVTGTFESDGFQDPGAEATRLKLNFRGKIHVLEKGHLK
ncbi:MAG: hypothetical protein ACXVBW_15270, partial [Bdellovibrionota bacterium]